MILPERVFGRILIKSISRGANPGAEPLTHVAVNIVAQFIGLLVALVQGDECLHDLHCQVVRFADHPRFRQPPRVRSACSRIRRADQVPGGVDHVVVPAQEPEITLGILFRPIAGNVPTVFET